MVLVYPFLVAVALVATVNLPERTVRHVDPDRYAEQCTQCHHLHEMAEGIACPKCHPKGVADLLREHSLVKAAFPVERR